MAITEDILFDLGFEKSHVSGTEHNLFKKGEFKLTHLIKENAYFLGLKSGCVAHIDSLEKLQELYAQETGETLLFGNTEVTASVLKAYGFQYWGHNYVGVWEKMVICKKPFRLQVVNSNLFFVDYPDKEVKNLKQLRELYHVLTGEILTPIQA